MNTKHRLLLALSLTTVMATGSAQAAGLMDSLGSAATELSKSGGSTSSGGMSLSSLSGLLNGGDKALSSSSMTNAAGILQYCVQNNVLSANGTEAVKDQLLNKLGISTANANSEDYQQGLGGLLLTGKGNTLDLNSLGTSQITEKVKQKACDLVLKQGMSFIS
ncbi:DUF2501 domain-containing protein [Serratia fonticola]|uniref:DUF2501 domain-containing protein n=1 Tax=Serratia fonticola TaxID=47917 RepID=UPI003AAF6D21